MRRASIRGLGLFLGMTLVTVGPGPARGQGMPGGRPLGGYGGGMSESRMGGPAIPYSGGFGGFMPYRMGGGSGLSFAPRNGASMTAGVRSPFRLTPMSGGMRPTFGLNPGMSSMPTRGPRPMGIMPPSFGYPFTQPPSPLSAPSGLSGMSM